MISATEFERRAPADGAGWAQTFFSAHPSAGLVLDMPALSVLAANAAAAALYGYRAAEELRGLSYFDLAGDCQPVWSGQAAHRRRDGSALRVEVESAVTGEGGAQVRLVCVRPRDGDGVEPRWRILEMVARYAPLEAVLDRIAETIELRHPDLIAAAMLVRDGKLYQVAGGRVPPDLQDALDGLPIEASGRVAAAPCWDSPATAVDIERAPAWLPWRELAIGCGLRCCWVEPVVSGAGEALGALAVYRDAVRPLDRSQRNLLQGLAHVAAIAIEQRNLTADLDYQAHHDPVTGLPNRRLFDDRLRRALALPGRAESQVGLLHIHLDRFKATTDLLGGKVGDLLLEQVARRIEALLRTTDTLSLVNVHDFAVILPGIGSPADAHVAAARIRSTLSAPFIVMLHELSVSASIGVAVYPVHGTAPAALVLNAETAAEAARRNGQRGIQVFEPEMNTRTRQRLLIESGLGRAVARGELQLMYQPQIEVRTSRMVAAEGLLRWKHPEIGTVSPGAFIPVAEETGLIVPIGRWAMIESCRQAAQWAARGGPAPRMAINVSGVQFCRDDFCETVSAALRETGLPASSLEIELTESALVRDFDRIAARMQALRVLGISIALDDFGTGYSWLSYLQSLPVDTIKVDRSFIAQITDASDCPALTASIVSMARALGKKVVAEGVETAAQEAALVAMGCDVLQGFRFGYPVDAATFERYWLVSESGARR
jgi:diguanylate cyclase (GGDEF)-like protein